MKLCRTCKTTKPKAEFGIRRASHDGLSPKCKKCLKVYDKARLRDPKRMKMRRDYQKTDTGKLNHAKACRKWIANNAIKRSAHNMVCNAVRGGELIKKPCETCGDKNVNAHHDDYELPLSVRWLCNKHHIKWHKENGEGLNAH